MTERQSPARFLSGVTLLGPNEAGAMGCSTASTRPRRPGSLQTPAQPYLIDLPIGAIANKLHQLKDSCRILREKEEQAFNALDF